MADERLTFTIAAIDKTKAAFSAIKGRIGSLQTAIAGLAVGAGLKKFSGEIDSLAKSSSKLGLTVNQLQSLQFAGELTGVSADKLTQGLARFSKGISEAASGTGEAKKSFEDLGISVSDNEGNIKSTEQLLGEVSDKMSQVGSSADKVRIANDLFGKSGVDLINTLSGGSEALSDMRSEFNQLTFELTGEQAKAVETANDNFARIGTIFSSLGQQVTAYLLPILARFALFLVTNFLKSVDAAIAAAQWMQETFAGVYNSIARAIGAAEMIVGEFGKNTREELTEMIKALEKQALDVTIKKSGDAAKESGKKVRAFADVIKDVATNANYFKKVQTTLNETLGGTDDIFEKNLQAELKQIEAVNQLTLEWDQLNGGLLVGTENLDDFVRGADTTKSALEEFSQSTKTLYEALQDGAVNALEGIEDSIVGFVQGTKTAKDAFSSMIDSIIADALQMATRQFITGPISSILNSFIGGIADAPPGRAAGGPVLAGSPYIVGERGPELFMPGTSGRIVPNGTSIGGGGVVVNVINNSGAQARTEEKTGANGMKSIDIIIDETVARNISTPGSRTGRALRTSFAGLSPALAGR